MIEREMFTGPIKQEPFKGVTPEGPYVAPRVRELVRPGSLQQEVADAKRGRELRPPAVGGATEVYTAPTTPRRSEGRRTER